MPETQEQTDEGKQGEEEQKMQQREAEQDAREDQEEEGEEEEDPLLSMPGARVPEDAGDTVPHVDLRAGDEGLVGERIRAALEEYGVCVVENAASSAEVERARELFWEWAESAPVGDGAELQRNTPASWRDENWGKIGSPLLGIVSDGGIGQSDFLWFCRTLPGVQQAFRHAWNVDEQEPLLTSFDGCGAFRNPLLAVEGERWQTLGGWMHVDQNFKREPGFELWQGLLNLFDASETTGSFVVVPRSHARFARIFDKPRAAAGDFVQLTEEGDFEELCADARVVRMPAGAVCLWDSRSIHASQGCLRGVEKHVLAERLGPLATSELIRLAAYICMIPRTSYEKRGGDPGLRFRHFVQGFSSSHDPVVRTEFSGRGPHAHFMPPPSSAAEVEADPDLRRRWELVLPDLERLPELDAAFKEMLREREERERQWQQRRAQQGRDGEESHIGEMPRRSNCLLL